MHFIKEPAYHSHLKKNIFIIRLVIFGSLVEEVAKSWGLCLLSVF